MREKQTKAEKPETSKDNKIAEDKKKFLSTLLEELIGTRAAYLLDKNYKILSKAPLSEIAGIITSDVYIIVFDGKINQSITDLALQKRVKYLVGTDYKEKVKSGTIKILTQKDFK